LRGLFALPPGERARPPLAARCERWAGLDWGEQARVGAALGLLLA
jgi:hypothetical protein